MPRKLSFTVTEQYNNKKAAHFLRGSAQLSSRLVNTLKRAENGILLNGSHARTVDIIKTGDILTVNIPDDTRTPEPKCHPLEILFEDEDILAVNKPASLAMHPTHNHQGDTLANAVAWHLAQKGADTVSFRAIGRLDKGTSGVVICALNKYAASRLTGGIRKQYLAVAQGEFEGEGVIDMPINRPNPLKTLRACGDEGDTAVTRWQAIGCAHGMSLLRLRLDTGRTHQIRVHLAHIGSPLVGDSMYGAAQSGFTHQLLHCECAEFSHPVTGAAMKISAPVPRDMLELIRDFPAPASGSTAAADG